MVKSLYVAHTGLSLKMFMLTKKTICSIINFLRGNTGHNNMPFSGLRKIIHT